MAKIIYTQSKHFIKEIDNYGMLVFSTYTGLTYAIPDKYSAATLNWLNGGKKNKLPDKIVNPLSIGWKIPLSKATFDSDSMLPNKESWLHSLQPNEIIAINWFLSGKCNFECKYCYANDLMYDNTKEPTEKDIKKISKQILSYKPLYVVLTGGEPLLSPFLKNAIKILSEKTGIVIDTNGTLLTKELIEYFKLHNVIIRISLDSPRPKENCKLRIEKNKKCSNYYNKILENIINCKKYGLSIIIQSVTTKINKNELKEMGDTLLRLGIKGWRILAVQLSDVKNKELFGNSVVSYNYKKNLDIKFNELKKMHSSRWGNMFSLQINKNSPSEKNSVVLVSSEGKFWTQSHIEPCKVLLDDDSGYAPSKNSIYKRLNIYAHYSRYLNG